MPPIPSVTKALLLACVGLFCLFQLLPPSLQIEGYFALWPLNSGYFLPWQPLSYAFLHGGFWHLLLNMFGLWMFGSELERVWGSKRYAHLLIASTLSAAAAQLIFSALTGSHSPTVGASGALFGLLLSFGMIFPNRIIRPLLPPIPMKAKYFVALFGGLELAQGAGYFTFGPTNVAHFAHLGGMLGAWLMMNYWRGARRR